MLPVGETVKKVTATWVGIFNVTQSERIASLETEVTIMKEELRAMNRKLDDLLVLRYKGAGAFWLAAALLGTGIVGLLTRLFHYIGVK